MPKLNQLKNISQLPDLVLCQLNNWDVIRISGEDRITFLQGQLTCDLTKLNPGQQTLAAQCNPQGKVWSVVQVIILEDRILLIQPSSVTNKQLPELQKYGVFSKVEISKETEYQAIAFAGRKSSEYIAQKLDLSPVNGQSQLIEHGIVIPQQSPFLRYLFILKNQQAIDCINDFENQDNIFDDSLWNAMNIAAGIPFIENETSSLFIPQMLNLQALEAINFHKGCYMGQETIARAKSRGTNKRALFRLTGQTETPPKAGDTVQVSLSNNWKRVGTVISGCQYSDRNTEILAVLPKESSDENMYQIKDNGESKLHITPLPYSISE